MFKPPSAASATRITRRISSPTAAPPRVSPGRVSLKSSKHRVRDAGPIVRGPEALFLRVQRQRPPGSPRSRQQKKPPTTAKLSGRYLASHPWVPDHATQHNDTISGPTAPFRLRSGHRAHRGLPANGCRVSCAPRGGNECQKIHSRTASKASLGGGPRSAPVGRRRALARLGPRSAGEGLVSPSAKMRSTSKRAPSAKGRHALTPLGVGRPAAELARADNALADREQSELGWGTRAPRGRGW
jgi:hypothetical protein